MSGTSEATAVQTASIRAALRCPPLPPLRLCEPARDTDPRRAAAFPMLRRGCVALLALALPALGVSLADPVHRARSPQATQAAAAPNPPNAGAAAAPSRRLALSLLDTAVPEMRP